MTYLLRKFVADSLLLSKLDQFDGPSFRQVRLITIVKKIFNGPDVFFCPFPQERFKILIRPHGYPLASDHFFPGGPRLSTLPAALKADSGPADLSGMIHWLFLK
jgi:hypothetical protein